MSAITVNIRNLAFGGDGVGEVTEPVPSESHDLLGIAAFVPFTIPGERVQAHITEKKKRYLRGELIEVIEPSPHRVKPRCKYYGACGGCELQHIDYSEQLHLKEEMIRGALRAGRLPLQVVETLRPVLPSEPFGYRRRITLHLSESGLIGFYREHSRSIVSIEECSIAVPEISVLLPKLSVFSSAVRGKVTSVILEADALGVVAVLKSAYALGKKDSELILKAAREIFENALLLSAGEPAGGFGREILELPLSASGAFNLQVPAGNFSQINLEVNKELIEYVIAASNVERGQNVFDLYSGAGNFALPLARAGTKVTAVEVDPRLVQLGKQNSLRYKFDRSINFIEASVERFIAKESSAPDLIVADPPRSGLGSLASKMPKAKRMVLISCHLPSCVRDLLALVESGYKVEEIQPFDMFAQTSYTEIATVLSR